MTAQLPSHAVRSRKFFYGPAEVVGIAFFREMFGCAGVAPVSIEMPKTKFSDFAIFANRKGYIVG
jgi:hypothetical protein